MRIKPTRSRIWTQQTGRSRLDAALPIVYALSISTSLLFNKWYPVLLVIMRHKDWFSLAHDRRSQTQ